MVTLATLCGVPRVTPLFSCEKETDTGLLWLTKQRLRKERKDLCLEQDEENKLLLNLKKGNFLFPVDLVLCLLHKALQEREGRTHIHISLCTLQKHYGLKLIQTHISDIISYIISISLNRSYKQI